MDFGQKNRVSEKKAINKILRKLNLNLLEAKIDLEDYVNAGWDKWKMGIVPARNFLIISFAALFVSTTKNKKIDLEVIEEAANRFAELLISQIEFNKNKTKNKNLNEHKNIKNKYKHGKQEEKRQKLF